MDFNLATADPAVTRALMERLLETFNSFKDEMWKKDPANGLRYMDGMMGFHNAYKAVILEIESQAGPEEGKVVRVAAVYTLAVGLGVAP